MAYEVSDRIQQLDPNVIKANANVRHGLIQSRIQALADSILSTGRVLEPVVCFLDADGVPNLHMGFYRHAAVLQLNAAGAGLTLPVHITEAPADEATRLKQQVAENVARSEMSPMDTANAIFELMEAGVPVEEVAAMFPRPGGKKGTAIAPASPAWLNIMLNLRKLPKAIQEKVHDGRVAYTAAYELGKITDKEKQLQVLARAEAEVARRQKAEEKDADRFATQAEREAKQAEKEAAKQREAAELETNIKRLKAEVKAGEQLVKDRIREQKAARTKPYDADNEGETKAWQESLKAADKKLSGAKSAVKKLQNELAKLLKKQADAKAKAEAGEEEEQEAAPAPAKGKKAVGPSDVKQAAKAEGVSKFVPLKLSEVRAGLKDISKDSNTRIAAIGVVLLKMVDGELTPKLTIEEMETILTPRAKK